MQKLQLAAILVGILIAVTWLDFSTESDKSREISLKDFKLKQEGKQKLIILESRRGLFHQYLEGRKIDRASCVAQLFANDTEQGNEEFRIIMAFIDKQIKQDVNQVTKEVVNEFINANFCPPKTM